MFCLPTSLAHVLEIPTEIIKITLFLSISNRQKIGRRIGEIMSVRFPIDVEDRLRVADAIKSVVDVREKIAMVVDHDILFQDYVSDRLMVFEGEPGRKGLGKAPVAMHEGMNSFLKSMGTSFRRDTATGRPRANKENSVKDKEQKKKGEYYYAL